MEYYANTATENDTFFGGTSGAGYVYPSEMPVEAFESTPLKPKRLPRLCNSTTAWTAGRLDRGYMEGT